VPFAEDPVSRTLLPYGAPERPRDPARQLDVPLLVASYRLLAERVGNGNSSVRMRGRRVIAGRMPRSWAAVQLPPTQRAVSNSASSVPAGSVPGLGLLVRAFQRLPESLVRWGTGRNWRRWFVASPDQQVFWLDLLDELHSTQLAQADLTSALSEMHDYATRYYFSPRDPGGLSGAKPGDRVRARSCVLNRSTSRVARPPAAGAGAHVCNRRPDAVMVTYPTDYIDAMRAFLESA
jgi:hypothetical protein